ncbi:hypothetical protein CPB83DRAFT_123316 [Crepidotus variabilis]|uniref:F-box domain-containing protein n=1 Tax=Crepidotus variabilis TaxID=179855 RepID=A0A9P6EM53_9AGAR|nr:hypothetical protein CPB83DRAFT_123316 [Crepidotus variabilis]
MDALADCTMPPRHPLTGPLPSDPLQNLPTELVSRVFELHDWSWPNGYLQSPLVLGAVCQLWRSIAWSTPNLWDVALFCLNPTPSLCKPSHDFAARTKLFKEYVDRSGALPLTIHVYANKTLAYEVDDEQLRPLVDIINERSPQWRNITLELPASLWNLLSVNRQMALPTLRTIRFSPTSNYSDENPAGELPLCFVQSLGNLKSLDLNRVSFNPSSMEGTWQNLQTLSASSWTFDICLEALRKAPSLRHATFTVRRDDNRPRADQPALEPQDFTINHDNLHNLTLNCRQALESDHFFDNLTLPSLESLTLSGYPIAASPVIRMVGRSRPELRAFELTNSSWKVEDLPSFLAVSKHLRTMSLNRPFFPFSPSVLFRKLFELGHLPKLEKLEYHDLWPTGGWKFVEQIPNLRDERGERTLRQVCVTLSTPKHTIDGLLPESSTLNWVDQLGKVGLEVGLCVKGPNVRSVNVVEASLR